MLTFNFQFIKFFLTEVLTSGQVLVKLFKANRLEYAMLIVLTEKHRREKQITYAYQIIIHAQKLKTSTRFLQK